MVPVIILAGNPFVYSDWQKKFLVPFKAFENAFYAQIDQKMCQIATNPLKIIFPAINVDPTILMSLN